MDSIFHEKQEGSLCAQHCLNALLQGPYFTAVDLADLAFQLDEQERNQLQLDSNTHASENMNEEGYFSIQVLSKALEIWGLELIPFLQQSPEAEAARTHPEEQRAFICNFGNHWFTIRRFGSQWFDLNSISSKPKLISTTYLTIYLAQLQQEGHSIFFITGNLPDCEAEQLISLCPVREHHRHTVTSRSSTSDSSQLPTVDEETKRALAVSKDEVDRESTSLQRVLEASRREAQEAELQRALQLSVESPEPNFEDPDLAKAIAMSLEPAVDTTSNSSEVSSVIPSSEELRAKRHTFLDRFEK